MATIEEELKRREPLIKGASSFAVVLLFLAKKLR